MTDHRIIPADLKPGDRVVCTKTYIGFTEGKEYEVGPPNPSDRDVLTIVADNDGDSRLWFDTKLFTKVIPGWSPVEAQADAERAAFEEWAQNGAELHRHEGAEYSSHMTQFAWAAWQARSRDDAAEIERLQNRVQDVAVHMVAENKLLQQRVQELETALRPFASEADTYDEPDENGQWPDIQDVTVTLGHCRAARAALTKGQNDD